MLGVIVPLIKVISISDFVTDIILLYEMSKDENLIFSMIFLTLTLIGPYLLSYSCGMQIYLNRGTFDRFESKNICIKAMIITVSHIFPKNS